MLRKVVLFSPNDAGSLSGRKVTTRLTRVLRSAIVLAILGLVLSAMGSVLPLCSSMLPYLMRHRRFEELKVEGTRIVQAVESFRQERGRYPETLSEALSDEPGIRADRWKYVVGEGRFYLEAGNYADDWFALFYYSDSVGWVYDT